MQKRTFPKYIALNILTMGIYGFVIALQMSKEIDALCKGDKQEPGVGFVAASFIRLIPGFGLLYYNYWWYQQINRLKLNANRYNLTVRESGTDAFLMRTVLEVPLASVTTLGVALALLLPGVLVLLFSLINTVLGVVFGIIFGLLFLFFSAELTAGAGVSNYFLIKNLNRFADVYRNGAEPFDPMAYEYYPCVTVKYPNFVAGNAVGYVRKAEKNEYADIDVVPNGEGGTNLLVGKLVGINGSCAGYEFELGAGEEIIIGKDAKVSMVVIDPAYKEISRKHVGVCYDVVTDGYRVVDYSSNGTWANGSKLNPGEEVYLNRGTVLKLANDKNTFRLG